AGPPDTSILKSLSGARKNPIERPSGDQNGNDAPSVPSNGRAVSEFSGRIHSWRRPSAERAVNVNKRPSGEMTAGPTVRSKSKTVFSGGAISERTTGGSLDVSRRCTAARPASANVAAPAIVQASTVNRQRDGDPSNSNAESASL